MLPTIHHLKFLLRTVSILGAVASVIFLFLAVYVVSQFDGTGSLPADCALVFGAAVHRQTQSGPGIDRRVATAAKHYSEGQIHRLLLTGGKGGEEQDSEAAVMRKTALLYGVDPDDVTLEDQATSTWENLLYSKPIAEELECQSVLGISDRYHLARIQYLAHKQGWEDFRTLPAEEHPAWYFETRAVFRETLGLIYYFLRDYIPIESLIAPRSDTPVE